MSPDPKKKNTSTSGAKKDTAWVAVIMGSKSDLKYLQPAIDLLTELRIPHEVRIVSAH